MLLTTDERCARELVGKMAPATREILDDLVGEIEELERELIDVEAFVIEWHRVREGERERGEVPPRGGSQHRS